MVLYTGMFQTFIVQPIFNILIAIYAIIPGHDFGIAVILLTILTRLVMWPLLKKQLHQTKVMRVMQPKIKQIKARTKGDKQAEAQAMMELYKEHGINPLGSIGVMVVQLPILFGLYAGVRLITENPDKIKTFTYSFLHPLPQVQLIMNDISQFHEKLFGVINLTIKPINEAGIYWPLIIMAFLAAILQYFQSKQLIPQDKDAKSLKQLLKEQAKNEKPADMADMTGSVSRMTVTILPIFTFMIAIYLQGALVLYLLTSALIGILQQHKILSEDIEEMSESAGNSTVVEKSKIPESAKKIDSIDIENTTNTQGVGDSNKTVISKSKKNGVGVTVSIYDGATSSDTNSSGGSKKSSKKSTKKRSKSKRKGGKR